MAQRGSPLSQDSMGHKMAHRCSLKIIGTQISITIQYNTIQPTTTNQQILPR